MTHTEEYEDILENCFNPYSSGLAVMTLLRNNPLHTFYCFNPYSSGLAVMTPQH